MITPYVVVLVWILCGAVAWKIAADKGRRNVSWVVLGQILGPFAIVLALLVPRMQ